MTDRDFVKQRIAELRKFINSLGIIRKIPNAIDYDRFDVDKYVRDLFGEVNWRYIHDIVDDNEEPIRYGYGVLFNEKYAFMFMNPEIIWLVTSESYHEHSDSPFGLYESEDGFFL